MQGYLFEAIRYAQVVSLLDAFVSIITLTFINKVRGSDTILKFYEKERETSDPAMEILDTYT